MNIFNSDIDFNLSDTNNLKVENAIAFPTLVAGDSGFVFFHSGLNKFYGWTGTAWVDLSGAAPLPLYLEDLTVTTTQDIDWNYDTFRFTMTGNTTFSEINLPVGSTNTKVITIYIDGDFTPTYPGGWTTYKSGVYDGTVLNQIVIEFIKTGIYWVTINRAD